MKKNSRVAMTAMLLALLMAIGAVFTSCGGPSNLEELVNSDEELKAEIESYSTDGMTIDIKENTVTYTYTYGQVFDENAIEQVSAQLEGAMDSMSSTFESVKADLIEESGFEGIVIKIVYMDANETILYETEY